MAQIPRSFVLPEGDEGRRLTNGITQAAEIELGDVDLWTFEANVGNEINLRVEDLSGNNAFSPELALFDPNGSLVNTTSGNVLVELTEIAPQLGTYTARIMRGSLGGSGIYDVRLTKTPPELNVPLTLGEGLEGRFSADGDRAFYVVDVPEGSHLNVSLDDLDDLGSNEVYLRRGSPPTAGDFV